jgi:hypothetical protein
MSEERRARVILLIVLVIAALLRFTHLDWDGFQHTHPDERNILFVASSMRLPEHPADLLVPARSTLNPFREAGAVRSYTYGHLPLYAMLGIRWLLSPLLVTAYPDPFIQLTLVGRGLSALYDALTVLVVGSLAWRTYSPKAGWLGAAFAALAVLHIQQAHFATVDTALALFTTLALWFMTRIAERKRSTGRYSLLAGLCAGLALGSKASASLLVVPLVIAHLRREGRTWRIDARLWSALLAMGLAFTLTNPYALLELPLYLRDIGTQAALVRGRVDVSFIRQYEGTLPLWYYIQQLARWGLGLPLTAASFVGLGWATWQAWSRRKISAPTVPLLAWAWVTLLVVGAQFVKFPRYMLPVTPVLFVFAAGLLSQHNLQVRTPSRFAEEASHRRAMPLLIIAVLLMTGLNALAFSRLYAKSHPWMAASEWIYDGLTPGSVLAVERGDDALPLNLEGDEPRLAALIYDQRALDPYTADDDLETLLNDLAASDYLILASNRLYGVVPRLDGRYPLGAAIYRRLFGGDLGFAFERAFTRYPDVFGLTLIDDTFARPGLMPPAGFEDALPTLHLRLGFADESFTVYDHPQVLVFHNEDRLSAEEMKVLILEDAKRYR